MEPLDYALNAAFVARLIAAAVAAAAANVARPLTSYSGRDWPCSTRANSSS